jgi:hypothetical protein
MTDHLQSLLVELGHSNVLVWQCDLYDVWRFKSNEMVGVQSLGETSCALRNAHQFSLVG